jgi:hypothetical protein
MYVCKINLMNRVLKSLLFYLIFLKISLVVFLLLIIFFCALILILSWLFLGWLSSNLSLKIFFFYHIQKMLKSFLSYDTSFADVIMVFHIFVFKTTYNLPLFLRSIFFPKLLSNCTLLAYWYLEIFISVTCHVCFVRKRIWKPFVAISSSKHINIFLQLIAHFMNSI